MPAPPRLVLDTNICLDLFVFHEPRCDALLGVLRARRYEAVSNAACRAEWQRVLRYTALDLDETRRAECEAQFDALIVLLSPQASGLPCDTALPRCKDRDDQKFLELTRDAGGVALLTRDAALLALSRRTAAVAGFVVIEPEDWRGLV